MDDDILRKTQEIINEKGSDITFKQLLNLLAAEFPDIDITSKKQFIKDNLETIILEQPKKKKNKKEEIVISNSNEHLYKFYAENGKLSINPDLISIRKDPIPKKNQKKEYTLYNAYKDIYAQTIEEKKERKIRQMTKEGDYHFPTDFYLEKEILFKPDLNESFKQQVLAKLKGGDPIIKSHLQKYMIPFTVESISWDYDVKKNQYFPVLNANVLGINVTKDEYGANYGIDKVIDQGISTMYKLANKRKPDRISGKTLLITEELDNGKYKYIKLKEWLPRFFDNSFKIIDKVIDCKNELL